MKDSLQDRLGGRSCPQELDRQLDSLADRCLDQVQAGEQPDIERLASEHPLLAERLHRRFELFEVLRSVQHPRESDSARDSQLPDEVIRGLLGPAEEPNEIGRLGRYRILSLLGAGAMGCVFKAEHPRMDRTVAIKVISPDLIGFRNSAERFEREVRAAARLHHPHIVAAFDADQVGGAHFLVMEYIAGTDLAKLLARQKRLATHEACEYVRQVALGLQHAHELGMVHRDLKPSNLIVTERGIVKILDFGLARLMDAAVESYQEADDSHIEKMPNCDASKCRARGPATDVHSVVGTPDYMSPEQATDPRNVDARSDIYSLGATLYHLLTGSVPFPATTLSEKLQLRQSRDPVPINALLPDLHSELVRVIHRMLARCPTDRYQTAFEIIEALQPFATQPLSVDGAVATHSPSSGGTVSQRGDLTLTTERDTTSQKLGGAWTLTNKMRLGFLVIAIAVMIALLPLWLANGSGRNSQGTQLPNEISKLGAAADSGAATAASSLIYGLKSRNGGQVVDSIYPARLYSFHPDGTGFADLGTVKIGATSIDADGLAYSPTRGLFAYQIHSVPGSNTSPTESTFLSIDPTIAAATPIGGLINGRVIRAAAFDAADRLWVVDCRQDQLLQIDPSDGQIIGAPVPITLNGKPINTIGVNGIPINISDIAMRDDGMFFATDFSQGPVFYNLDISTGVLTQVVVDTALEAPAQGSKRPAGVGLAFAGDAAFTFDYQGTDDIYKYDTAAAYSRSLVFGDIISQLDSGGFNSGQGDLATAAVRGRILVDSQDVQLPHEVSNRSAAADSGAATSAPGLIYGLKSRHGEQEFESIDPTRLYSFHSDGTSFTDLGTVKIGDTSIDADGLAYSPTHGLFAFQIHPVAEKYTFPTDCAFLSINPMTAAATPIGGLILGRVIRAAAFDAEDRLWIVDCRQDQLLQIDPSNGQIIGEPVPLTLNGKPIRTITLNGDPIKISDIAARDDGEFFATDFSAGTVFYTLSISTGALTEVAVDKALQAPAQGKNYPRGLGLAFAGATAFAYDGNGTDDIYKYDTAAAFSRSLIFADIISELNPDGFEGCQGDLASAAVRVSSPSLANNQNVAAKPLRDTANLSDLPGLQDVRPFLDLEFDDPAFTNYFRTISSSELDVAYDRGRFVFQTNTVNQGQASLIRAEHLPGRLADFACEFLVRMQGANEDAFIVMITNQQNMDRSVKISLAGDQTLHIGTAFWDPEPNLAPTLGPISNPAILGPDQFNRVLIAVTGRMLRIYVNNVEVVEPIDLGRDVTPGVVAVGFEPKTGPCRVELDRVRAWNLKDSPPTRSTLDLTKQHT